MHLFMYTCGSHVPTICCQQRLEEGWNHSHKEHGCCLVDLGSPLAMCTSTDHSDVSLCVGGGEGLLPHSAPLTPPLSHTSPSHYRMAATLSKIGEGAFADVFGCQGDDWRKLALKVHVIIF